MERNHEKENAAMLDQLFSTGLINLERGSIFEKEKEPVSGGIDFDKVEGMLLGIAIGDSLGVTTEGQPPSQRRSRHGEIRDYIPNRYIDDGRGYPSDDTQLSFWTLEQLIEDGGLVPENLARRFANSGRIFGIGSTVRGFLRNYDNGIQWYECGPESAGNGALMRIAPILVPNLKKGGTGLWVDAALAAMLTHNDRASTSACVAIVSILRELIDSRNAPESDWWLEKYVDVARDLEGESSYEPRGGSFRGYRGPLWRFTDERLHDAERRNLSVVEAADEWYSGAYLLETVPSVIYTLMKHADDPEEAIVRAVNDTKDNDTIAAIVGAAVGALHGKSGLPERWIDNLSGRTGIDDDGKVFDLIEAAKKTFA